MVFIPLGNRGVLVHVLDDVPPANASVVSTETDLAFLSAVGDDAHLRAAEIVIEQILEPHAGDEQEIPTIRTTLLDIVLTAATVNLAVVLTCQTEGLVELLKEFVQVELRWRVERAVMLQKSQSHHDIRRPLAARRVSDLAHVLHEPRYIEKSRDRAHLFGFFVNHYCCANTAVRVAAAGNLSPVRFRTVHQIGKISERSHQ